MSDMEKNFFTHLLNSIKEPVLVIDSGYRVKYMNAAARVAGDCHSKSATPPHCYEVMLGSDRHCEELGEECPVRTVFETSLTARAAKQRFSRNNGKSVYEVTASPIFNDRGEVTEVVEVLRDVTDSYLLRELRTSEERYRSLLESTPDAVITINEDGLVIDCNPAVGRIFGIEREELTGLPVTELIPERLRQRHLTAFQKSLADGIFRPAGRTMELTGMHRHKGEFPLSLSLSTWTADEKKFFTAIIRDISHYKDLENRLRREKQQHEFARRIVEEKHRELEEVFHKVEMAKKEWELTMDCVEDIILLIGDDQAIKRCNNSLVHILGKGYREILGRPWKQFLTTHGFEDRGLWGEEPLLRHVPSGRTFAVRGAEALDDRTGISGYVLSLHDITYELNLTSELEDRNTEIRDNNTRLQAALNQLAGLIQQVTDRQDFSIRYHNPTIKNCWEVMDCNKKDCPCHGKEGTRCWQIAGTLCGGIPRGAFVNKYENCLHCPVYEQSTSDHVYHLGEHFNNMMHILEEKNRELSSAYSKLKKTHSQLLQQEKMASIGQLAAGVAHEINNPIGFVTSNLSTLKKYTDRLREFLTYLMETTRTLPAATSQEIADKRQKLKIDYVLEDLQALLDESLEGVERVSTIVGNLKSFSRVDQAVHEPADLNECLDKTINIIWNELNYTVTLHRDYGELPQTRCYPQQLNQVFMNLLMNAAQAIGEKGNITITTRAADDVIHITISDDGGGIEQEHIKHIFEPFFTTKPVGKGTGLGLSIVYDIITEKHNGEITVASEVGKGTTLTIKIPVVKE